jgi:xylulokinase
MSLMGADLGTSGCRAAAFDTSGEQIAASACPYPLARSGQGAAELDADLVWSSVCACIADVNSRLKEDTVTALAFAVLGEAVIPVNSDGVVLAHAPLAVDMRAARDADLLGESVGEDRFHEITGQFAHPMLSIAKVRWWYENDPELWSQAAQFLCFGDFAVARLGLPAAIDYTMASRTGAFDLRRRAWSEEILDASLIDRQRLARPVAVGTPLGAIPAPLAEDLGFDASVILVAGAHDQAASMWGSGAVRPGQSSFSLGTSECLTVLAAAREALNGSPFPFYAATDADEHILLAGSPVGGGLLEWLAREFAPEGCTVATLLTEADEDDGAVVVLPYFAGTGMAQNDPGAKGAIVGLTLDTKRGDVVRGILESSGFELAANLELLARLGLEVGDIRVVGGATRTHAAVQRRADAADRRLTIPTVDASTCRGAALIAGCGTGIYASLAEAPGPTGSVTTVEPRVAGSAERAARRATYQDLYPALNSLPQTYHKGNVREHHLN